MPDQRTNTLFSDLSRPEDTQFRMQRLQVMNWGTFAGLHTMDIPKKGIVITGDNGSGKSTLLDAMTVLLIPPASIRRLGLNAASDEGAAGGRDRTVMSYVRGAWRKRADGETDEVVTQFLRPGATWSALALTFGNAAGRVVSLVRVFWTTSGSTDASAIKTHSMVVDGVFDLTRIGAFTGDRRALRAALDGESIHHYADDASAFHAHFRRVIGVDGVAAFELLHRAQSFKDLHDLNEFMRSFLLPVPPTFEKAERLVAEFHDLRDAHEAVVRSRRQIETLSPARAALSHHAAAVGRLEVVNVQRDAIPHFRARVRADLLDEAIASATTEMAQAQNTHDASERARQHANDRLSELREARERNGGGAIGEIERRRTDLMRALDRAQSRRNDASAALAPFGWSMPDSASDFARAIAEVDQEAEALKARRDELDALRDAAGLQHAHACEAFQDAQREVRALESSDGNMPDLAKEIRRRLIEGASLAPAAAVYVGELIQVRPEHAADWRVAAERLLRSFAQDLLVRDTDLRRVTAWVKANNLRGRLTWHGVKKGGAAGRRRPQSDASILHYLEVKEHPFGGWVWEQLLDRFDYECVASADEINAAPWRITREGVMHHAGTRIEKDDRPHIQKPTSWLLGFDNREKLEAYKERARGLAGEVAAAASAMKALADERASNAQRLEQAQAASRYQWEDVDVASIAQRIAADDALLTQLKEANGALQAIEAQIVQQEAILQRHFADLTASRSTITRLDLEITAYRRQAAIERDAGALLDPALEAALRGRMPAAWSPRLNTIDSDVARLHAQVNDAILDLEREVAQHQRTAEGAFEAFLRAWPAEAADLQPKLAYARDFMELLDKIESDGLTEHEARFHRLLNEQSRERLAELHLHLDRVVMKTAERLCDVNEALRSTSYSPGTYLVIKVKHATIADVVQFTQRLRDVVAEQHRAATADLAKAEAQFAQIASIVADLGSADPEKARWRNRVLDTRRHVIFRADEMLQADDSYIQSHTGTGGVSGGQGEKLTITCLGAALRFQMGGSDGGVPQYGTIVLDEAFKKCSKAFTAMCLETLTHLGFHPVIATPDDGVMRVEAYVGGAAVVGIEQGRRSSLLPICYMEESSRLGFR